jgi:fucose 4-O-acetylase-like acetyltransferase
MRDDYLDISKAILIFLVVFGHFLERLMGWSDLNNHVLLGTIYFIHMPAFIMISGMLYKDRNYFKNILFFLSLYIPFQIALPLFDSIWTGKFHWQWNIFERPYWILWYLLGMIVWTLLTHLFIKLKLSKPIIMLTALTLSLLVGYSTWNNYQYSVGRIFVFFPFFIIGFVYGKSILSRIQQHKFNVIFAFIILIAIASLLKYSHLSEYWLYGSLSYQQLKVGEVNGTLIRLGCFTVSCLGIYAFFSLMKLFQSRFIQLGRNTLPVYLLHGFLVIALSNYLKLETNFFFEILICFVLSVFVCYVLQQNFFDQALRKLSLWLMKPTEKLWKK